MKQILLGLLTAVLITPALAEELVLEKEFWVLRDGQYRARSLSVMPDGAVLLTADNWARREGVAVKIDAEGKEVWRYVFTQKEPDRRAYSPAIGQAALGDDGKVLVCANETTFESTTRDTKALFVLLGPDGHPIHAQALKSSERPDFIPYEVTHCGRWGDSYYAVAEGWLFAGFRRPGVKKHDDYAWVLRLNAHGIVEWDRLVKLESGVNTVSVPQVIPGGDLLIAIAGRNQVADVTNLATLSPEGRITRQSVLPVQQRVVEAVDRPRAPVSLGDNAKMVRLDLALQATSESEVPQTLARPPFAYLDPSGRLTSFWATGSQDGRSVRYVTRGLLDPLKVRQWNLPTRFANGYWIDAATRAHDEDLFFLAFDASGSVIPGMPEKLSGGLVISRIRFVR